MSSIKKINEVNIPDWEFIFRFYGAIFQIKIILRVVLKCLLSAFYHLPNDCFGFLAATLLFSFQMCMIDTHVWQVNVLYMYSFRSTSLFFLLINVL